MHTWHRQSPAAHVFVSDKLILGAQVMRGGAVFRSGALSTNATVSLAMHLYWLSCL